MDLMDILIIAVVTLVFIIFGLSAIYLYISIKNKSNKNNNDVNADIDETYKKQGTQYTKLSVFDFMEFDKIEDDMIVQKNSSRYLMVVECEGINYDLMSAVEKTSVEQGFIQFLNTLRHPIQLYTQTRTINIGSSIEGYSSRISGIQAELNQKQGLLNRMIQNGGYPREEIEKQKYEIARLKNLHDYGIDIIGNIERLSSNRNVLRKHYYIIVPYHVSELGGSITDEEEKRNMIFSELYTRATSIISTLFGCGMKCRVMTSEELIDLLYTSYNRDEAEVYGVEKALKAGYTELYSTAPDVLDKKMEAINKEIEEKAFTLASDMVEQVKNEKEKIIERKEETIEDIIKEMATVMIKQNSKYIGQDVAKESIEKIKSATEEKEESAYEKKQKEKRATGKF